MNKLIGVNNKLPNEEMTMSSREIAGLVGSRHVDLMRSIDRLSNKNVINGYVPVAYTNKSNNQRYFEYLISKRDTYIIVAQNSPEFTAVLVDRWQELESKQQFRVPQTMGEALQLAADQEKQIELQAPKVSFFDKLVESSTLMTATQVATKHGISAARFNQLLDEVGGIYNNSVKRSRVFTTPFINKCYGRLKQTERGHSQALFTTSGEAYIYELLVSEGL